MNNLPVRLLIFLAFLFSGSRICAKEYRLISPNKSIEVDVVYSNTISYNVKVNGCPVLSNSHIGLLTDRKSAKKTVLKEISYGSSNDVIYPIVRQKCSKIVDHYNQLRMDFSDGLSLEVRAYDSGMAWRWVSNITGSYKILSEKAEFAFPDSTVIYYPQEKSFYSGNEPKYSVHLLKELGYEKLASLPVLFTTSGIKVLITESNLLDYAGMWLETRGSSTVDAVFPYYPKAKRLSGDRDEFVESREDYIARYSCPVSFPWRVIALAGQDKDLLGNTLVYQLADASKGDFSWVEPGKVQWDWWNDNNIYNVGFKAGLNTDTYKYYIDFAAANGLQYVMLDEGWYLQEDIMKVNPAIDVPYLVSYAQGKGVGIILWCTWVRLDQKMVEAMDVFEKWGVKGIKVDFMSRDDQEMVQYYIRVSQQAARHHLIVDFHGCYKPTGLYRTYPNVLSYEGVYGQEQCKVDTSKTIGPNHNLILPFTRMVAGPMDYTPGAMLNQNKKQWHPSWSEPSSQGTRCHQLAMYVVFESPLEMLCDSPTHYLENQSSLDFLKQVPTVWNQSIPLAAVVGEYVAMARESANGNWYLGAMTNDFSRSLKLKLDFLYPNCKYCIKIWQDGYNVEKSAKDVILEDKIVDNSSILDVEMAEGGGYVAIISKVK